MSELKEIKTDTQATAGNASESAPMHWPGILVGVGMVCLFGALFVGAAMKESGGLAPKILGAVGLVVMVLGIVGTIVHAISSRAKRWTETEGRPAGKPPVPDVGILRRTACGTPEPSPAPGVPTPTSPGQQMPNPVGPRDSRPDPTLANRLPSRRP